jgi:AcrR family transcriptional regulator
MRLFMKQGYQETTIEQIAEAADISPSTFFNYFPNKEDVVITDDYDPLLLAAFTHRPLDEGPVEALRQILGGLGEVMDRDHDLILARSRLILSEPELRARSWSEMEKTEDVVRGMLAARTGRDADDFELRVLSGALVGGLWSAILDWVRRDGEESLGAYIQRTLDVVEKGLAGLERPG